jgi:hypothetical protein
MQIGVVQSTLILVNGKHCHKVRQYYYFLYSLPYEESKVFTSLYKSKLKSKLYYDRQAVGQSALLSGTHLGPVTNFFPFSIWLFFYSFGFLDVGRPLWREVGSVLFSLYRASPAQPFSDLSPTGLMSIVYCLYFFRLPNQKGQVPVFISPRNTVAQLYLGHWVCLINCSIPPCS